MGNQIYTRKYCRSGKMSSFGFKLIELKLSGPNLPDAIVSFKDGLNVITGPSDTGKSFILECVDYALGKGTSPKAIKESEGYSKVTLTIKFNSTHEIVRLTRVLSKANAKVIAELNNGETLELAPTHSHKDELNISTFLLKSMDLDGKKLKKNKQSKTENLSFRALANLVLIDEEKVITSDSPFYSGITTKRTAEKSLLHLLLSGLDDSMLVENEDPNISKAKSEARTEVVLGLIEKLTESIPENFQASEISEIKEQLVKLSAHRDRVENEIENVQNNVNEKELERKNVRDLIISLENRVRNLQDLHNRFNLLGKQYEADLLRIEAIAEASNVFNELNTGNCPVCGSEVEHHSPEHLDKNCDPLKIKESCTAEELKTKKLYSELHIAKADVYEEEKKCQIELGNLIAVIQGIDESIEKLLKPQLTTLTNELLGAERLSNTLNNIVDKKNQLNELNDMITPVVASVESNSEESLVDQSLTLLYDELSQILSNTLIEWSFPGIDRVSFDDKTTVFDFNINGRPRSSHGKGVRAVFLTAVMAGLFKYCLSKNKPHVGFVMIDSPLVVYREPDPEDSEISADVKSNLYASLARDFKYEQFIVIENVEPPENIDAHIIHFTKNQTGRYGFIPVESPESE